MISLVIGGGVSYLSIRQRIQDMPLLFSPSVTKIYNQPVPVAARAGLCSGVQNFSFGHSKMHSYFLQWGVKQFCMYWLLILYMQKRIDTWLKISLKLSSRSKFFRRGSTWDDALNFCHPRVPACSVNVVSLYVSLSRPTDFTGTTWRVSICVRVANSGP